MVNAAAKWVQKLTSASKAAIAPGGAKRDSGGGKKDDDKWKSEEGTVAALAVVAASSATYVSPGIRKRFWERKGQWRPKWCASTHLLQLWSPGPYICELP